MKKLILAGLASLVLSCSASVPLEGYLPRDLKQCALPVEQRKDPSLEATFLCAQHTYLLARMSWDRRDYETTYNQCEIALDNLKEIPGPHGANYKILKENIKELKDWVKSY